MDKVFKNELLLKVRYRITSIVALLVIWWLFSLFHDIIPTPYEVAIVSYHNIISGSVAPHFIATFYRIIVSLFFAMLIGLVVGIPMGLFKKVELYLDTWVLAGIMIPATSYGVIILIVFGLNNYAAIAAITITTCPVIIVSIWKGVKVLDNDLNEMARVFRMPMQQRNLRVVIPQLYPAIMGSLRYGLSIIWKVTVVIELIGLTSGIGYMLMYWFSLFRMHQVLSWTLMFTIVIIIFEWTVLSALEKKVLGWKEELKA